MKFKFLCLILILGFLNSSATYANDFHQSVSEEGSFFTWKVTHLSTTDPVSNETRYIKELSVGSTFDLRTDSDVPSNVSYYDTRGYYTIIINGKEEVNPQPMSPISLGEWIGYTIEYEDADSYVDVGYTLPFLYPTVYRNGDEVFPLEEYFEFWQNKSRIDSYEIEGNVILVNGLDGRSTMQVDKTNGLVLQYSISTDYPGPNAPNFSITYEIAGYEQTTETKLLFFSTLIIPLSLTVVIMCLRKRNK